MRRAKFSYDDTTFDEIVLGITSPTVRGLLNNIQTDYKTCAQAAWRKSVASEVFDTRQLETISGWDNDKKVEALIGCASTAAECKKIATHIDQALTLFTHADCLARHLMEDDLQLTEASAVALIQAYGRRMKGHRQFPFFGTRHSTAQEEDRARRAFIATVKPFIENGHGRAYDVFRDAIGSALPLPDPDYKAFLEVFGSPQRAQWEEQIKEAARRKRDSEDVKKLDKVALLDAAAKAIADFAREHADERFYAFALDATMLCLDSVEQRAALIEDPDLRSRYLDDPQNAPLASEELNPGDFAYQGFFDFAEVSPAFATVYGAYFESNRRSVNGRIYADLAEWLTNALASQGAFDCLAKIRDFRVTWSKNND